MSYISIWLNLSPKDHLSWETTFLWPMGQSSSRQVFLYRIIVILCYCMSLERCTWFLLLCTMVLYTMVCVVPLLYVPDDGLDYSILDGHPNPCTRAFIRTYTMYIVYVCTPYIYKGNRPILLYLTCISNWICSRTHCLRIYCKNRNVVWNLFC